MKVGIYCKHIDPGLKTTIDTLLNTLHKLDAYYWIHPEAKNGLIEYLKTKNYSPTRLIDDEEIPEGIDYLISIGGDGTFLESISAIKLRNIPLLGINTGRLGFLADISPTQVEETMTSLNSGDFSIEKRNVLKIKVNPQQDVELPYALNEFTVHKRDTSSMIKIDAYIADSFLTSYWADGLIVSTPTGSTAYSLSAGGPIVSPDANVFIITPLAPHNLNVRPLVIPNHQEVTLRVESRDRNYLFSIDSRSYAINEPLEIMVKKADKCINLIKFPQHNFYNTLRNKLMWGIDKRN